MRARFSGAARRRVASGTPTPAGCPQPEPHAGRSGARLFGLIPALAPLVGALWLFAPTPAEAQTVWSATLTVQDLSGGFLGCDNDKPSALDCDNSNVLTDDDFSYGGANYKIIRLHHHSTGLQLALNKAYTDGMKTALTLNVGSNISLPLANASYSRSIHVDNDTALWSNSGVSWSAGNTVTVTLTEGQQSQSSDAKLSGLTASSSTSAGGTFSSLNIGTFSSTTTSYTATVANARTHVKLTPTANHSAASISWRKGATGSFTPVTSGSATTAIALDEGANAITVRVTAEDSTTQDYTVTVTRQAQVSTVPTGLSVTAGNAELTASWTAPTGVNVLRYEVQIKLKSAANWPASDTDVTGTSHTFTGLTNGSPYQVRVRTIEVAEQAASDWTAPAEGTPQAPAAIPTVSLSASPNPVLEGSSVRVTATLSSALSSNVTIPLTLTAGLAESGDYGTLSGIIINSGATSAFGTITTAQDNDEDDETFTVALGTLPSTVTAGTPSSVEVTISDDDKPFALSVNARPACGATVTDLSVKPSFAYVLTPAPAASVYVEYRVIPTGPQWVSGSSVPITPDGRSARYSFGTFAELRQAYAGFTGFEFRLTATPGVTARCTWQFDVDDDDGGDDDSGDDGDDGTDDDGTDDDGTDDDGTDDDGTDDDDGDDGDDDDGSGTTPSVSLGASPNPVGEGSTVTVTATLTAALSADVTIPLTLTAGTAEEGDYGSLSGITITAGQTAGTGTIATAQDTDADDETFTVALGTLPSSVTAGGPSSVEITITDDEKPSVSLSASPNPVGEGSTVTVTATLTAALSADVTIPLTLTAGTAEEGDYGSLSGITITAGQTAGTGTIATAQDTDADDETFTVALGTLPSSVTAGGPSSVEITITDDEKPSVSLSASPNPVGEGSTVTVTATLTAALSADVTIPLTLTAGTAEEGDYGSLSGITITAGQTAGTGTIATAQDTDADDETFTVALGTLPPEVTEGSPSSVEVTIRDTTAAQSRLFVPIVLQSAGRTGGSFFTSEMILTNRGPTTAAIGYTYTAAYGGGSGTAVDSLGAGEQRVIADAITYLTALGVPVGSSPAGGTLRVDFSNLSLASDAAVTLRVTTPVEEGGGRAGLSYYGLDPAGLLTGPAFITGLRQNEQDRSNLAIQNAGVSGEETITLRVTLFSGDPAAPARSLVLPDRTLPPGGFHQYNGILDLAGFDNGYVKVEPVGGTAPFYCYGVINDNFNSDGAFVFPLPESSLVGRAGQTLPVIIESGNFRSELTVTNFSASGKTVDFRFVADAVDSRDDTARFSLTLEAGEQVILPDIVEELRRHGVEGIGPADRAFMGALFATPAEGDMGGIVIGARTGSPDGRGGQYSLFYDGVPYGSAFTGSVWIYGLQQNGENRSNLALVNTGEIDDSSSTFELTVYDGSGAAPPRIRSMTLGPRRWTQVNGILGDIGQGYVQVRKTSGNNPFFAYGVINDGGAPGERSGDGAYLPARE